jgi:hypothetical protein
MRNADVGSKSDSKDRETQDENGAGPKAGGCHDIDVEIGRLISGLAGFAANNIADTVGRPRV